MNEKTTDREELWRALFDVADMPFPPYVTRGVRRLDESEASSFLATLTDIRRLPERAAMADDRTLMGPAVRALLELWDEQLLAVWLEAQVEGGWHRHTASEATWPMPVPRPS